MYTHTHIYMRPEKHLGCEPVLDTIWLDDF